MAASLSLLLGCGFFIGWLILLKRRCATSLDLNIRTRAQLQEDAQKGVQPVISFVVSLLLCLFPEDRIICALSRLR